MGLVRAELNIGKQLPQHSVLHLHQLLLRNVELAKPPAGSSAGPALDAPLGHLGHPLEEAKGYARLMIKHGYQLTRR